MEYTDPSLDVPSPIDLREQADAQAWASAAESARPGRPEVRAAMADELEQLPAEGRVLELGSGPGFLAEHVLAACANVASYTLLDFSPPMLELSKQRLLGEPRATFVLGDFKRADWPLALAPPYSAIISMQAVHEIRHKRHVPQLYRQLHALLNPGGMLLVADHTPADGSLRSTCLFMNEQEQRDAFQAAGFQDIRTLLRVGRLILVAGSRA